MAGSIIKKLRVVVEGDATGLNAVNEAMQASGSHAQTMGGHIANAIGNFAGELMVRATEQVAEFAKKSVAGFTDLQQQVADLKSIKPEIDTSQVFGALNEMSTRVPQTAHDLARSLYDVFSATNVTQKEGIALVEKFTKGAIGAQTDAKTFGTAVLGVMNSYRTGVAGADHISDLFFNTIAHGVVTGKQLAAGLGSVTANAKAAGQTMETQFAAIVAVSKNGDAAARNMTRVASLFKDIINSRAQKGFAEIGISVADTSGHFKDLATIVGEFIEKTKTLSDVAKADIIGKMFGNIRSRQGFQDIVAHFAEFKEALVANQKEVGATAEAYKTMVDTFQNQSKLLENSLLAVGVEIASQLLPKITPFISAMARDLPGAIKNVQPVLAAIGQWFSDAFAPIMPMVRDIVDFIVASWGHVVQWFSDNLPLIQTTVQKALEAVAAFWKTYGATIISTVNFLVGTAGNLIKLWMQVMTGDFSGAFSTVVAIVKSAIDQVIDSIRRMPEMLIGLLNPIQAAGQRLGRAVADGLTGGVKDGMPGAGDAAKGLADTVIDTAKSTLKSHSPSQIFDDIGSFVVQGFINGIVRGIPGIMQAAGSMANAAVKGEVESYEDAIGEMMGKIKDARKNLLTAFYGEDSAEVYHFEHPALSMAVAQAYASDISLINWVTEQIKAAQEAAKKAGEDYANALKYVNDKVTAARRSLWVSLYGENSAAVLKIDHPSLTDTDAATGAAEIARLNMLTRNAERAKVMMGELAESVRAFTATLKLGYYSGLANPDRSFFGLDNSGGARLPLDFGPALARNHTLATLPRSPVANSDQLRAGRVADQTRDFISPFMTALESSAAAHGEQVLKTLLGGNRRGKLFSDLWGEMASIGRDALNSLMSSELKRGMVNMVKEVGDQFVKQVATLQLSAQSVMQVVTSAYQLLAASQRHKQFGIGSILGGIAGFALGGPGGAIAGYNAGNALDNGDYRGAFLAAGVGAASGSFSGGKGFGALFGGSSGTSALKGAVDSNVNINVHGDINNLGGLDQLRGTIIDGVQSGLRTLA